MIIKTKLKLYFLMDKAISRRILIFFAVVNEFFWFTAGFRKKHFLNGAFRSESDEGSDP